MNNERNDHYEIYMTGNKSGTGELPAEDLQNYFSAPVLDSKDGEDWNSRRQKENNENISGSTSNISDSSENIRDPNEYDDGSNSQTDNGNDSGDGKTKKLIAVAITVLSVIILAVLFWPCSHVWMEANCTTAKTCSKCEKTEGTALGHQWKEATCVDPSVCSRCKETSGTALGHNWKEVTENDCVEAKVINYSQCTNCKKKDNQTTDKLESFLSANKETFLITPAEFAERLNRCFAECGLNVTWSWAESSPASADLKMNILQQSETIAQIRFFSGESRNTLNILQVNDLNEESAFKVVQMLAGLFVDSDVLEKLCSAVIKTIEPGANWEEADMIKKLTILEAQEKNYFVCENIVYGIGADEVFLFEILTEQLFA